MRRILNLFFYFLTNFEKKMGELRPKTERKSAAVKLVFWRRAARLRRACGEQISASLCKVHKAATECTARERPRLPLRGLTFERRLWRMQRERQAAAVRKCESE